MFRSLFLKYFEKTKLGNVLSSPTGKNLELQFTSVCLSQAEGLSICSFWASLGLHLSLSVGPTWLTFPLLTLQVLPGTQRRLLKQQHNTLSLLDSGLSGFRSTDIVNGSQDPGQGGSKEAHSWPQSVQLPHNASKASGRPGEASPFLTSSPSLRLKLLKVSPAVALAL
jgi:hypothetical protein